jgi:hypothetical protein
VHAALAYRYAARLPKLPEWFVYRDGYEAIEKLAFDRPDLGQLATRIFTAYEDYYKTDSWRAILVEEQLVVMFENGEPYSCRVDLLATDVNGDLWIVDHKTCGKPTTNLNAKYCTDRQMLTNVALARACGYPVRGVVINEISREMPYPSFQRETITLNAIAYDLLGITTNFYLDSMKRTRIAFPDPMNRPKNTDACVTKFGPCDFWGLCWGHSSLDEFRVPAEYLGGRVKKGT